MSAISVSIPPVRHALVTTVELKYLNCRHSNVRIGGIRDNNVTFYMGTHLGVAEVGDVAFLGEVVFLQGEDIASLIISL